MVCYLDSSIAPIARVTCTVNPPIGGAVVNETTTIRAGEFAVFECVAPFRMLIGNPRRLCLTNGSLELPLPICTGNVKLTTGKKFSFNVV